MRNEAAVTVRRLRKEHPTNRLPDRHVALRHRPDESGLIVGRSLVMDRRVAVRINVEYDKPGQRIAATSQRARVNVSSASLMVGSWVMVAIEDDIGALIGKEVIEIFVAWIAQNWGEIARRIAWVVQEGNGVPRDDLGQHIRPRGDDRLQRWIELGVRPSLMDPQPCSRMAGYLSASDDSLRPGGSAGPASPARIASTARHRCSGSPVRGTCADFPRAHRPRTTSSRGDRTVPQAARP